MKLFTKVMKALSDTNRVKIVKMLQHKRMCVCEIQEILAIAQPSVSKHLKILEEAGLVENEKQGLWVNYFLNNGESNPYASTLIGNLKYWLDDQEEIKELKQRLETVDRNKIKCKS